MYKIGQFAKLININLKTLQRWDRENKFKPEVVTETKRRLYSHKQYQDYMKLNFNINID